MSGFPLTAAQAFVAWLLLILPLICLWLFLENRALRRERDRLRIELDRLQAELDRADANADGRPDDADVGLDLLDGVDIDARWAAICKDAGQVSWRERLTRMGWRWP